jgi:hypothetical protein
MLSRKEPEFSRICRIWTAHGRNAAGYITLFLSALFCHSAPTHAGSFELIKGKRYELCRSYDKNLKSFPDLSDKTEEWPLDPKLKDFSKPNWTRVDIQQHKDVVKTLYIWSNDPNVLSNGNPQAEEAGERFWQQQSKVVTEQIDAGVVRLERAQFDFDGDGYVDTVYRYYHPLQFVYRNLTKQAAGYWYIYYSGRNPRISGYFRPLINDAVLFDSFFFKQCFHLITWFGDQLFIEQPTSLNPNGMFVQTICEFRYRP